MNFVFEEEEGIDGLKNPYDSYRSNFLVIVLQFVAGIIGICKYLLLLGKYRISNNKT